MANFDLQNALSVTYKNASDKDKLQVIYGVMLKILMREADYASLINTNYSQNPVKGGSVHVDRMAFATVRDYLTAHAAGKGDAPQNNGVDVLVNNDKEIVTEVAKKDVHLWRDGGIVNLLANTYTNRVSALKIYLDRTYCNALQLAATVVNVSAGSTTIDKLLILIQTAETTQSENIDGIDRADLVLTLGGKWYDEVEKYMVTLPNPSGNSSKSLHGVEVRRAARQSVDAVVQARGSMAMPMVLDEYTAGKPDYKNAVVKEMYFSYGVKPVMPEAIYKAALDSDISI